MGGDVTRVGNARNPGSDGASPYLHHNQNKTASQITRKTIGIKTGALTPRN